MTDLDLILSPDELDQLRAGARLRLTPSIAPPSILHPSRHYPHARFAQLCYSSNPVGAVEQKLLKESIDLVVCGGEAGLMAKLNLAAPPATPILLYTNISNLPVQDPDQLDDWLGFAATRKIDPESALLHDAAGKRLQYPRASGGPLTNPSNPNFIVWCIDYHRRLLKANPRADGLFIDNSMGSPPLRSGDKPVEDVSTYSTDYAALLKAMASNLGTAIVPNIAGSSDVNKVLPVVKALGNWYGESWLQPLWHDWSRFEDVAKYIAAVQAETNPGVFNPICVIDSHPAGGDPTDPRTQLAALCYYYLLAQPTDYLDFFGGAEPWSSWSRHWCPAAAMDIGAPLRRWTLDYLAPDPADLKAYARIYCRAYSKATVFFRPLSKAGADLGPDSALSIPAKGRPLAADGTIGPAVSGISLRNGEGAIVMM